MSDSRRRRRLEESDDEGPTYPPARRRRYNTRSAVREERNSNWHEGAHAAVSLVRIPFPMLGDYSRILSRLDGSRSHRTESRNSASSSRSRDGHSSSRSRNGGSSSRSHENGSARMRTFSASGSSRHRNLTSIRRTGSSGRSRIRLGNPSGSSSHFRTYTAMSTGGRLALNPQNDNVGRRNEPRSLPARSLARNRSLQPLAEAQIISRIMDTENHRRSDDVITAFMMTRSLNLIRARRTNPVVGNRRFATGQLSPRPTRGGNIVNRTPSNGSRSATRPSRGTNAGRRAPAAAGPRSASSAFNPSLTIEDIIGIPPPRRVRATARMSTSQNPPASARQSGDSARTRVTNDRGSNRIRYNMTHNGGRLNIRVAFASGDDTDPTDRLFPMSGESEAASYLNGLSDVEMSTDDVFYSDTDRHESDSGDSNESGSTATPHSLVSLSLNALHPSPTPSLSSAETTVHPEADAPYPTEPVPEEDEEEVTTDEVDDEDSAGTSSIFSRTVGNPTIFLHNNISVHLLSRMAELAETFSSLTNRLQQTAAASVQVDGFRGFTPPRHYPEPTRRRVPEGVDCQRSKLIDELNSNTSECVICTDTIKAVDKVWPCNNCFNIFHLPCIRKWAKTNRATEITGAWICPVCRRPKFCGPNKLRYRCLCGRLQKPKPQPGVTPHCCGKPCKHNCGLLCHPGPCKMSEAEAAAFARDQQSSSAHPPGPGTSQEPTVSVSA